MQEFVTQRAQRIVVAGATGRVGRHVVEILRAGGHEVVPISRSTGVDVITGEGLPAALCDADCIIDVATSPSAAQGPATEFFTASGPETLNSAQAKGAADTLNLRNSVEKKS